MKTITVKTSPSLAIIKYWGKFDAKENLPATSSLALTLDGLFTESKISISSQEKVDKVFVDGKLQQSKRFAPFFEKARALLKTESHFFVESTSNFPTAAGLASSSSGFSALAFGIAKAFDPSFSEKAISSLARFGSASASRSVFGGITVLEKEKECAAQLFDKDFWKELRVIIAIVKHSPKKYSSRLAMERAKKTSPMYKSWLEESEKVYQEALLACQKKDLHQLGPLIRKSYQMMFSTMFTSSPPIIYWEPESLALIQTLEALRERGFSVWETMDAGPQVKILTVEKEAEKTLSFLKEAFPLLDFLSVKLGDGAKIIL